METIEKELLVWGHDDDLEKEQGLSGYTKTIEKDSSCQRSKNSS